MQAMPHSTEPTSSPNASQRTLADTAANENGSKRVRNKEETSPSPARSPAIDPYLVYFKVGDPECPFNFPLWKKWMIVLTIGCQIIWVAGIGASWSPGNANIAREFGTSELVARIPQAMYLVGFSLGPVVLTPFSEDYGRKYIFFLSGILLYIFQIPVALAPNYATLIICRFLGGFVAAPIFNSCCNVPDMWRSTDEGMAGFALNIWAFCAESVVLAPIWGSYINVRYGWRWIFGVSGIVGAAVTVIQLVLVPETRHTVILGKRAAKLRKETGDDRYHALGAISGHRSIKQVLEETLYRPVFMLITEPIVSLFALYDGLNYGIIYLAIEAVPIVYEEHGFHEPGVEFIFFALVVGFIIGVLLWPLQHHFDLRLHRKRGEKVPEGKLLWGFFAAVAFPASLFLFGWLALPRIHWFASIPPLALFGLASHILFLMISDYTVDSYGSYASSAVTGQSFARELMSAALIIVGQTYYTNLGPQVATSILGAIAVLLGFVPFLFYYYGPKIRAASRYSQAIQKAAREDDERAALETQDSS